MKCIFPLTLEELEKEVIKKVKSCGRSAEWRTKNRDGYKKRKIKYLLPTGNALAKEMKEEHSKLWEQARKLTTQWLYHHKDKNKTPTFDRFNDGNYAWSTINIISKREHDLKDNAVAIHGFDFEQKIYKEYETMTDFAKIIGCSVDQISKYCDSGRLYNKRYLIQSISEDQAKSKHKRKFMQKAMRVRLYIEQEFNDSGNVINETPKAQVQELEFPEIKIKKVERDINTRILTKK